MIELLLSILVLATLVLLAFLCIPRLAAFWFAHTAWTIPGADLEAKFKGLLLFGLHGSYLKLSPKGEKGSVCFTKHTGGGETVFRLRITSERLDPDRIGAIETKLDALASRIRWSSAQKAEPGNLEIEISGPVVSDPIGMEGVATLVLTALGYASSQRYRVSFEGPADERAAADYYSDYL